MRWDLPEHIRNPPAASTLMTCSYDGYHRTQYHGKNDGKEGDDEHHHIMLVLEVILQSIIHILHLHFRRNAHQFLSHLLAGLVVQRTGGLIAEQELGVLGQRPGRSTMSSKMCSTCGCSPRWAFRNQISPPLPPRRA